VVVPLSFARTPAPIWHAPAFTRIPLDPMPVIVRSAMLVVPVLPAVPPTTIPFVAPFAVEVIVSEEPVLP
jgi:hypothetical protein